MHAHSEDQNPRGLHANTWVGNPNLNKCLYWYTYLACKHIEMVSIGLYCVDPWSSIWKVYDEIKGLESMYTSEEL